ncbi:MAG: PAS domain-containing protein [Desulfobulbia bacterium]
MLDNAFPALIQNAALLLAMAFIYDVTTTRYRLEQPGLPMQLAIGMALGVLGIIIMLSPWRYVPGIVFDTRSVLLGISGLFFGVAPTAVAMAMTAAFRLFQGGSAAWTGVAVILSTGAIGLVWQQHRRLPLKDLTWKELYLFGLLIHLDMLAMMLTLPWDTARQVLAQISLPVLTIYPLATALLGLLMVNRLRREDFITQLQAGEEQLRLALIAANQGLYDLNVQTGEATVSPEYATMLEYDPDEFHETNARWIERLHPADRESVAAAYQDYIAGKTPEYRVEFRQQTKTGEWKWILSLGKVVEYDPAGRPLRMLGTHTDITKRKQAEEALEESEKRFRSLFEDVPNIAVQGYDRQHRVVFWNTASEGLYGFSREEALGRPLEELIIPPEMRPGVIAAINSWQSQGIAIPAGELVLQKKGGQPVNVFSSHVMQLNIHGEPEMYCIDIDLTERKRSEEERDKLQAQLLQSQKMELVGRLAGGVAHDFNNMLQTILGYSDLTLAQIEAASPVHDGLLEIRKAAMRSADLTRQLLAFARKQAVSPKILDLNDTVAGMLKMLQRLIGEDLDLAWVPGHSLWPVKMDPSQLDQILANLAVNARDAIADTGKITIETENISLNAAYCADHPETIPGEYVQLVVSDNGCGMDKETLAQIFEPFFTTKTQGKGTGLGLATVYGIVRQNNGFVNVYSEPGQGTTFRIYLPSFANEMISAEIRREEETSGGTETVLLVEDDAAILNLGTTILQRLGYTVLAANTPMAALELVAEYAGEIHLLITDVVMPEMNGRELVQRLSALRPAMHCLYMSGYTANVIAHHGVLDPGIHFIQKPFSIDDLARSVRETLRDEKKNP